MWGVGGTETAEAGRRYRVSFDDDDETGLCLHHSPGEPRVPCAGVRRESCLDLCALGRRRRRRGRLASHDGCSYGR